MDTHKKLKLVPDDSKIPAPSAEEVAINKISGIHEVINVKICTESRFDLVPNLLNGGKRKRKYAMVMSLNGIPNFHERQDPLIIPNALDTFLIDADTLPELRARCMYEVDKLISQIESVLKEMDGAENATEASTKS